MKNLRDRQIYLIAESISANINSQLINAAGWHASAISGDVSIPLAKKKIIIALDIARRNIKRQGKLLDYQHIPQFALALERQREECKEILKTLC